eukprot:CAMPEP_0116881142 /NCGR_PEP_ID=MMETSP0463-20121206/13231_1 /TAXON_ID=181622 /ORGANISM="Strombidinopsis sp, Strain SopsisLIS2011" /LENGTH=57 /DNA_ID=CAMNT_0004532745 /DNA_START=134 /DNA_END=307 /DNA_ORIENTATION=-
MIPMWLNKKLYTKLDADVVFTSGVDDSDIKSRYARFTQETDMLLKAAAANKFEVQGR